MTVIRSPALTDGGEVCVVRLCEVQVFARGGLARGRKARELTLHLSVPEMKKLSTKWGKPKKNATTNIDEYTFPRNALRKLERFAAGGGVGIAPPPQLSAPLTANDPTQYGRTRNTDEIKDYYTYGMGPEHQFYNANVAPTQPQFAHLPQTPTGATTQSSGGGSGAAIAGLGSALVGGSALANAFGYNNALTQGASTVGNLASGNLMGAAKNGMRLYGSLTAPGLDDYASGQATNDALTKAGITGEASPLQFDEAGNAIEPASAAPPSSTLGNIGKALGTASDVYGVYSGIKEGGAKGYIKAAKDAASLAGYDVDSVPIVGAYNVGKQLKEGDVGGAGVTAASMAVPLAGLGFAATALLNKSLTGHGDEKRNMGAFLGANPLGLQGLVEGEGVGKIGLTGSWLTGDNKLLSNKYVQDLAGAYYGSQQGDGGEWTQKYQDLLAHPVEQYLPPGYSYRDGHLYRGDKQINTYLNEKKVAHGGAINAGPSPLAASSTPSERHVRGPGTGRSDSIPAQLSDGEYVLTAEDVSLLGDGSNEAGAKRLDGFRQQLRKHKGGALARGKISPNAKSPLQYMRGIK